MFFAFFEGTRSVTCLLPLNSNVLLYLGWHHENEACLLNGLCRKTYCLPYVKPNDARELVSASPRGLWFVQSSPSSSPSNNSHKREHQNWFSLIIWDWFSFNWLTPRRALEKDPNLFLCWNYKTRSSWHGSCHIGSLSACSFCWHLSLQKNRTQSPTIQAKIFMMMMMFLVLPRLSSRTTIEGGDSERIQGWRATSQI